MQYGNHALLRTHHFCLLLFKSYYVVWKPFCAILCAIFCAVFKSYYVVWKLVICFYAIIISFVFKSYYVVWKQNPNCLPLFHRFSLNRTMQYGNLVVYFFPLLIPSCLNRTMQYGNWSYITQIRKPLKSLNRTMQYGNHLSEIHISFLIFV